MARLRSGALEDDPLWYMDATIYQIHVRTFADSNGDGIGDFRGLTGKLDYIQDLGVSAIWLLPFYPSPLRDDGYDIADYKAVNPAYGTIRDFQAFLDAAHRRGLRVITELVVNHTSDQHAWFQRARRSPPGSKERNYYVWSDDPHKYEEARIIFQDFETSNWSWDPVAQAYYWHRFYHHQPDLNYELPEVHEALFDALDFWLEMGVDGMRLDAVPYLYEREGTNCENLPEGHEFLRKLRRHVDERFANRMFLAEANQWPEDAVRYFGNGDECQMCFHFPVMPRLFMALRMEDSFPVIDILQQTPQIPEGCQWAVFLRNHDELTLEMVTDEDRDYMYRVYASDPQARLNLGIRRRLAPLLGNDRRRIELMNALLFSLPGTPIVYYGDEIGMGDNIYLGDRNSVRTPMQWSADRNAGFSRANPQKLYLPVIIDPEYHYEAVNVEAKQANPHSLVWWMKRLIAQRKRYRAFSRGSLEFVATQNHRVLAFLRSWDDERILVVANLSRFVQHVELDPTLLEGTVPLEVFGDSRFPRVTEAPYSLTMGPHTFFWFRLEEERAAELVSAEAGGAGAEPADLGAVSSIDELFSGAPSRRLLAVLERDVPRRRWFGSKARSIRDITIVAVIPVLADAEAATARLLLLRFEFTSGEAETYSLLLVFVKEEEGESLREEAGWLPVARLELAGERGFLGDGFVVEEVSQSLLGIIERQEELEGSGGMVLYGSSSDELREIVASAEEPALQPTVSKAEQSNTSVIFEHEAILKFFRKVEAGPNPDLEISRFLTERASFPYTPSLLGSLELRRGGSEPPMTLGLLQRLVENQGDAWTYSLDSLSRYFERILSQGPEAPPGGDAATAHRLLEWAEAETPLQARDVIGTFLPSAELLGRRTAEMHLALGSDEELSAFRPEPFTTLYQRSLYQSMRTQLGRSFELLERRRHTVAPELHSDISRLLRSREEILGRFQALLTHKIEGYRQRCHGDYHLGQVLFTGRDFVIIDFEGEPARPLSERRLKRSPMIDVAGMVRSFHYAARTALLQARERGLVREEQEPLILPWVDYWYVWVSVSFLRAYLDEVKESPLLPRDGDALAVLLEVYLLHKAVYELAYELNHRPDWVGTPLRGLMEFLGDRFDSRSQQ